MFEEACRRQPHEIHIAGCVDAAVALKHAYAVPFASAFDGSGQTRESCSDNEHGDAGR